MKRPQPSIAHPGPTLARASVGEAMVSDRVHAIVVLAASDVVRVIAWGRG